MDKLDYLIEYLFKERGQEVPKIAKEDKFRYYRSLVNVRMPQNTDKDYIQAEDEYLTELKNSKGVVNSDYFNYKDDIALFKGDITTIKIDAIVNAANSQLLGCFYPCHACIDNTIHTFAGIGLRKECYDIMLKQGHEEPTGKAKITKGYNLPAKHVIHTVGPIVYGDLTDSNKEDLASCYNSCLKLADDNNLKSIAFCCISTGEFHFPNDVAAEIAVKTVKEYKQNTGSKIKVVFNVFKELDYEIYQRLLYGN